MDELREAFEAAVSSEGGARATPEGEGLLWLDDADDPASVMSDLERLEPCGERNPAPRFVLEAQVFGAREVRGGHLKLELVRGKHRFSAFGVGMGERAGSLSGTVTLVGDLRRDTFLGGRAVEIHIEELRAG
jgi:single-stranded-DNA-specific exonuclease